MKKMIAEFFPLGNGSLSSVFYCIGPGGESLPGPSQTLFALIEESIPPSDAQLEALVGETEAGRYTPKDPRLPDWSVNNKDVWLAPPMAHPGHIAISNEYSGDFAVSEGAEPQQFTYAQFRAALKHWREFLALIARDGKEHWVGRRYETEFPE